MTHPTDLGYTDEHEWVRRGDPATVGITAYAADALGDVVFVQLPVLGRRVDAGQVCGELESTKSVSDLYAPVDGEVVEVNDALVETPELINTDPYGQGWVFKVRIDGEPQLLDAAAYGQLTGES